MLFSAKLLRKTSLQDIYGGMVRSESKDRHGVVLNLMRDKSQIKYYERRSTLL